MERRGQQRRQLLRALGLMAAGAGLGVGAWASARAATRTVTDMAGREVALPAQIRRIASAGGSPAVNAFLFLFGQGPRIVTGMPSAFASDYWKYQRLFAPAIAQAPVVSGPPPAWTPDIEALLRLAPDLSFVVDAEPARQLERAGLSAVVLNWHRLDSVDSTVRLLGDIFAMPERARAWLDWRAELLGRVAARVDKAERRPRVLYARMSSLTQPIMVPANHLIASAGGESVTARDNPMNLDVFPFSVEQVLAWNPEFILVAFPNEVDKTLADPRFASLDAVRNKRVFPVPRGAHIWTHYTPEHPLGVAWAARLLHPQAMAGLDVEGETRDFYQRFFGHALADTELRDILAPGA